jgi:hypothetical protein
MSRGKKMPNTLVKLEIPPESANLEIARWSIPTPDKKSDLLHLSVYRTDSAADQKLYVASWSARAPFGRLLSMMQIAHQQLADDYDLSPLRLQYNLRTQQLAVEGNAFEERDPKSVDQFLRGIKPPAFARVDGVFFGISLEGEASPRNACFASFYKMPYAVSAIWAASGPSVGEESGQRYIRDLVASATDGFPNWSPEMYAKLSQTISSPRPSP